MNAVAARAVPDFDEFDQFKAQLRDIIPSLRSFARGLCSDRELADDLAQDALAKAWASRNSFVPGTNFRAWIFTILRNQFYSSLRRDRHKRMIAWEPEDFDSILHSAPDQEEMIHLGDVIKALQGMRLEQREVLILIGAQGLSYEEAADIMGCPVGTIKSRLARARAALTRIIDGQEAVAN